jgi:hypothetical protein
MSKKKNRIIQQNARLIYRGFPVLWAIHQNWNLAQDYIRVVNLRQARPAWLEKTNPDFDVFAHYCGRAIVGVKKIPFNKSMACWAEQILNNIGSDEWILDIIVDDRTGPFNHVLIYSAHGLSLNELLQASVITAQTERQAGS